MKICRIYENYSKYRQICLLLGHFYPRAGIGLPVKKALAMTGFYFLGRPAGAWGQD